MRKTPEKRITIKKSSKQSIQIDCDLNKLFEFQKCHIKQLLIGFTVLVKVIVGL